MRTGATGGGTCAMRCEGSGTLGALMPLSGGERRAARHGGMFRLGISPYYLSLIDPSHPFCPVRMQAIPVRTRPAFARESWKTRSARTRPARPGDRPPYPDRVLLPGAGHLLDVLPALHTPAHHQGRRGRPRRAELERALTTSGLTRKSGTSSSPAGTPFLSEARLEALLAPLRDIPARGDRANWDAGARVSADAGRRSPWPGSCDAMPPFVVTHFNHPKESRPRPGGCRRRLVGTTGSRWRTRPC